MEVTHDAKHDFLDDALDARRYVPVELFHLRLGFATGLVAVHLVRSSFVTRMIVAFVAVVTKEQLVILASSPTDWAGGFRSFLQVSLPSGLYTALIAPIVMALVGWAVGWHEESGRGSR